MWPFYQALRASAWSSPPDEPPLRFEVGAKARALPAPAARLPLQPPLTRRPSLGCPRGLRQVKANCGDSWRTGTVVQQWWRPDPCDDEWHPSLVAAYQIRLDTLSPTDPTDLIYAPVDAVRRRRSRPCAPLGCAAHAVRRRGSVADSLP